jgi:hypothetical protein
MRGANLRDDLMSESHDGTQFFIVSLLPPHHPPRGVSSSNAASIGRRDHQSGRCITLTKHPRAGSSLNVPNPPVVSFDRREKGSWPK